MTTTHDMALGPGVTMSGYPGWRLYESADDGRIAVMGKRGREGTEWLHVPVAELVDKRALPRAVGVIPGGADPRVRVEARSDFERANRAALEGARVLVYEAGEQPGRGMSSKYVGADLDVPDKVRPQAKAVLEQLDWMRDRLGRVGVDDAGAAVKLRLGDRRMGAFASWHPTMAELAFPEVSNPAGAPWTAPSIIAHELAGHGLLAEVAPNGHRLETPLQNAEAFAVHEGFSDAMGYFRTGSAAHGAGPNRDGHRFLDDAVVTGANGARERMLVTADDVRAQFVTHGHVDPYLASGTISHPAWKLGSQVGRDKARDIFHGALDHLGPDPALRRLDFSSVGRALRTSAAEHLSGTHLREATRLLAGIH